MVCIFFLTQVSLFILVTYLHLSLAHILRRKMDVVHRINLKETHGLKGVYHTVIAISV